MITLRDALYSDVEDVMDNIGQISGQEMLDSGVDTAWKGLGRAKMCKDSGFLKVATCDGKPLFIFGGMVFGINTMRTWFIGTDEYFGDNKAVRATIRHLATIAAGYPHFSFESASRSSNPNVMKWFKTLGFSYVGLKNGARIFRYIGRNSTSPKDCVIVEPEPPQRA